MLYVGEHVFGNNNVSKRQGFEAKFQDYIRLKNKKLDEVKKHLNDEKKKKGITDDDPEGAEEKEEDKEDIQETFLKQFPGLSPHYCQNKQIFKKGEGKAGFDIKYGNWIAPSCCSLLVNFVQWMLTFSSIMLYKGDGNGFWLPELIRADLEE